MDGLGEERLKGRNKEYGDGKDKEETEDAALALWLCRVDNKGM